MLYEEVIIKYLCLFKIDINSNIYIDINNIFVWWGKEVKLVGMLSSDIRDYEEVMEDCENIYEIILGD